MWILLIISILIISGEGCKLCVKHGPFRFSYVSVCIEPEFMCDGKDYCHFGEDEIFCGDTPLSNCPSSFQCPSGECIKKELVCNGKNDCGDSSDEFYCEEMNDLNCPNFFRKCADGTRCLQSNWWCDGSRECLDGSDESYCGPTTTEAPTTTSATTSATTSTTTSAITVPDCGGKITETSGHITSPGFPHPYPHFVLCKWEIIAPPEHIITLKFNEFDLEPESNCYYDNLEIQDILAERYDVIGRFCGRNIPSTITSQQNRLKITFHSDSSTTGAGFNISFTVTSPAVNDEDNLNKRKNIHRNVQWLLNAAKDKKGIELPRAVLALFLASPEIFAPGNRTGNELRDRLKIRILSHISRNTTIRSQELALYVQALMVVCEDPRDFYGRNMVSELRARVDKSSYSNPFEVLALCNAGESVTQKDVDRVSGAFDSKNRPFWTDVQALATMSMQCLSSKVTVDKRKVRDLQDELKKRQFSNGTVENLVTTALVIQALSPNGSSVEFFNLTSALDVLLKAQREDGSWGGSKRNSFYLLPALSGRSFLDIGNAHCPKITESEEESLARLQESKGEDTFVVQYSVWLGSDVDLGRTWRLRVRSNVSFYDVLETVSKLDSRHNVSYQVVDGKPYVRSMLGKEDDPELGIFWFLYLRSTSLKEPPTLLQSSPADVVVNPNQELIMWYKPNTWRDESAKEV